MAKKCTISTACGKFKGCRLVAGNYLETNGLSLDAYKKDHGYWEPLLTVTVNIGYLADGLIAIKDYSENEGVLQSMQKLGIVGEVEYYHSSGFVRIPVCRYDIAKLNKYVEGIEDV